MQEKENKYDHAIDLLRIISILAVVLIHTTTRTLEATKFDLERVPWTLFLNQISRFAVPLFFMLSGFVLELNYPFHASYFTYLKKRIARIFVPYVFWSAIYYFFVYEQHTEGFIQTLIHGDASYQMYFIPSLLLFYLIFPLVHKFYSILSNRWILIILGILQIHLLYDDYFIKPVLTFYPLRICFLSYFIFLLGVIASHHKQRLISFVTKWKTALILLMISSGGYIFYEGFSLFLKTKNYLYFYSQWRVSILIYSILVASLLYVFFQKPLKGYQTLKEISKLTFFVFFIHVIILEKVWGKIALPFFAITKTHIAEQFWYDPSFFLIVIALSYCFAYAGHKTPWLAKITG